MADSGLVAAEHGRRSRRVFLFGAKFAITCVCFWYAFRQISSVDLLHEVANVEVRWLVLAVACVLIQIPLVGVRWTRITEALEGEPTGVPLGAMLAITWIANLFAQILPNVMSDALRIWLLSKVKPGWRKGLIGVLIDRGVGVGALLAIGLVTLANASAFTALSGRRQVVLLVFAVMLIGGISALVFAPIWGQALTRYRTTRWLAEFIFASRRVLVESPSAISIIAIAFVVHLLTIADIWCLGRSLAMALSVVDAAALFTLMVAIALVPVTVSGWGLRELAVTAFLTAHGLPPQRALLFSICFGLTQVVAALPGAIVLLLYSSGKMRRSDLAT